MNDNMSDIQDQTLRRNAVNGMVWKFLEHIGMQVMQLVIQIVLARFLLPEEYGLVGLLSIFISISDVIILQGLTTALIQKKHADEVDFSSVFYANLIISGVLYGMLYVMAPWIADFYHEPILTQIMRVLTLNVVIGAVPAVHNAILSRNLEFKKSFYRNMSNVVVQGFVGIFLAYIGCGVWALVYSKIAGTFVGTVVLCITVHWHPKKFFDMQRIKGLFAYGSKVLGTNLLNTVFNNIHSLIIGRYYTAADLGYYQRGQQIPQMVMSAVDGSMASVLYPTFSKLQNDIAILKSAVRRSMKTSMFLVLPILFGLFAVAEPLTIVLLTERWLPSVPFMKLSCIVCMFWPLTQQRHALNAMGKSGLTFKISLMGRTITLITIFVCIQWGIYAIMLGSIFSSMVSVGITGIYVKRYIQYSMTELIRDIAPILLLALGMCLIVSALGALQMNLYLKICVQIIVGVGTYTLGAAVFRLDSFQYVWNIVKRYIHK